MMKPVKITYKIAGSHGRTMGERTGYAVLAAAPDGTEVPLCLFKSTRTWLVDHHPSGMSLSVLSAATRKALIALIETTIEGRDTIAKAAQIQLGNGFYTPKIINPNFPDRTLRIETLKEESPDA